jgi:hypothetical protein
MTTATRQNPTVNTTRIQSVAFKSVTRVWSRPCRAVALSSAVVARPSTARPVASRHAETSRISKAVPDGIVAPATAGTRAETESMGSCSAGRGGRPGGSSAAMA